MGTWEMSPHRIIFFVLLSLWGQLGILGAHKVRRTNTHTPALSVQPEPVEPTLVEELHMIRLVTPQWAARSNTMDTTCGGAIHNSLCYVTLDLCSWNVVILTGSYRYNRRSVSGWYLFGGKSGTCPTSVSQCDSHIILLWLTHTKGLLFCIHAKAKWITMCLATPAIQWAVLRGKSSYSLTELTSQWYIIKLWTGQTMSNKACMSQCEGQRHASHQI